MNLYCTILFLYLTCLFPYPDYHPAWGFYGHRLINQLAVFSLPVELIPYFKPHVDWLSSHAVDADKRRYAIPSEGIRHYIDLDHWHFAEENTPKSWHDAVILTGRYYILKDRDTVDIGEVVDWELSTDSLLFLSSCTGDTLSSSVSRFVQNIKPHIEDWYAKGVHSIPFDSISYFFPKAFQIPESTQVFLEDRFSEHGILPYYLRLAVTRLTKAFYTRHKKGIFRLCADIGHYLSDAHVPLHTTKNYNGQLTGQLGIHAFWESRVPELLAEREFDLWAGKAQYIEDIDSFLWKVVRDSHAGVDEVLSVERELRVSFPEHRQYEFSQRNNLTVRQVSQRFTRAYHNRLDHQVEKRMRQAIYAVSSIWYTAWVNAGQPEFHFAETEISGKEGTVENALDSVPVKPPFGTRNHERP